MKEYICKETFIIEEYDDNGFSTDEYITVKKGSVFKLDNSKYRMISDSDVRLEGEYQWLEIDKEMLDAYFERVED